MIFIWTIVVLGLLFFSELGNKGYSFKNNILKTQFSNVIPTYFQRILPKYFFALQFIFTVSLGYQFDSFWTTSWHDEIYIFFKIKIWKFIRKYSKFLSSQGFVQAEQHVIGTIPCTWVFKNIEISFSRFSTKKLRSQKCENQNLLIDFPFFYLFLFRFSNFKFILFLWSSEAFEGNW